MDIKNRNILILGFLILIICFASVKFNDKLTGKFGFDIEKCTDSDVTERSPSGKNYFLKGTVKEPNLLDEYFGGGNYKISVDKCLSKTKLREYYCIGYGENIEGVYIDKKCKNGCLKGACVEDCGDTDGENPFVKGYVDAYEDGYDSFKDAYHDYCEIVNNETTGNVIEYICGADGYIDKKIISCEHGCENGACVVLEPECIDTDGRDYNTKGTVTYCEDPDTCEDYTDECTLCSGACTPPPDSICTVYCYAVTEYYCEDGEVKEEMHTCGGLCEDGACVTYECTVDDDCDPGYVCVDHVCVEEPEEECELTDAYWDDEDVEEGDYVYLVVRGTEACDGESASFTLYEYEDDEETDYYVSGCVFNGVNCVTDWRAHYEPEDFDEDYGDELEFYFVADVNDLEITSDNELTVTEEAGDEDDGDDGDEDCYENWDCSGWSACIGGKQTRSCVERNNCGTEYYKPKESMSCTVVSTTVTTTTGTCYDGIKNQGESRVDCGGPCDPCASCFDEMQNCHDGSCEEGVDCGGTCMPCKNLWLKILITALIILAICGAIFGVWYWKFKRSGEKAGRALSKVIKRPPTRPPFTPPTRFKVS